MKVIMQFDILCQQEFWHMIGCGAGAVYHVVNIFHVVEKHVDKQTCYVV